MRRIRTYPGSSFSNSSAPASASTLLTPFPMHNQYTSQPISNTCRCYSQSQTWCIVKDSNLHVSINLSTRSYREGITMLLKLILTQFFYFVNHFVPMFSEPMSTRFFNMSTCCILIPVQHFVAGYHFIVFCNEQVY